MRNRRRHFLFFVFLVELCPWSGSAEAAERLFIEEGAGFLYSSDSEVGIVRLQKDTNPLFGRDSFYEAVYAKWGGDSRNEAVGLARGVIWRGEENDSASLTTGLSRIARTTGNLGQPFEFYGRLAYTAEAGPMLLSLSWIHISDAKFLFKWSGPNNGENFLTVSLGVQF